MVAFGDVPELVLDATTSAEDRTFWANGGFDAPAIISAAAEGASGSRERGASTITQQLVRARLLPSEVTSAGADRYMRKAKELIQAMRVSETFPGEAGQGPDHHRVPQRDLLRPRRVRDRGRGPDLLRRLRPGRADARPRPPCWPGCPSRPRRSIRTATRSGMTRAGWSCHRTLPPVVRRDWILGGLGEGARWTKLTQTELAAARAEPVVLAGEQALTYKAAHFTWQVRRQLDTILGSAEKVETGGYKVITTLDMKAQGLAEKWLTAGAIVPNVSRKKGDALMKALKIPKADRSWVRALRGKDLHNGALVALDYRTGDVLAYAGSAGYYRDNMTSSKFSPKYDAAGDGSRQPGSAFKPILYAAAFNAKVLTPGSLLLDVTTEFNRREDWAPRDADQLERGPVLVRKALQYSLNIPAIRTLERVGNSRVDKTAEALGLRFTGGREAYLQSGLAGALGTVEVRPLDLTSAYGALANGGVRVPPRMILAIEGPDGKVVWHAPEPEGTQAVSPQAAFLVTDILAGNTDKKQNPIWAEKLALYNGKGGSRRPAAVKTGTSNDARDLATYGYLAPPKDDRPALAVGVWMGNSDHSNPRSKEPAISLTAAAPLWHAFVRDYSKSWPITNFQRPKSGLVKATIDAWTGGKPGPWTRAKTTAWFIAGTQPGARKAIDPDGLMYTRACGSWRVDLVKAELGPSSWDADVADWMRRARGGPGRTGQYDSRTAYFWKAVVMGWPDRRGVLPAQARPRQGRQATASPGKPGKPPKPPEPTAPPAGDGTALITAP